MEVGNIVRINTPSRPFHYGKVAKVVKVDNDGIIYPITLDRPSECGTLKTTVYNENELLFFAESSEDFAWFIVNKYPAVKTMILEGILFYGMTVRELVSAWKIFFHIANPDYEDAFSIFLEGAISLGNKIIRRGY